MGLKTLSGGGGGGFQAPRVPQKLYLLLKYSSTECMNLHHNPTPNRCVNLCQLILITTYLYRPQNEVWGKVIVLLVCVILFTGGGGLCLGESLSRGSLSRGVSVQGVSVWETPWTEIPPYGKERAVRILLKCKLVKNVYCNEYSPHSQAYMALHIHSYFSRYFAQPMVTNIKKRLQSEGVLTIIFPCILRKYHQIGLD